MGLNLENTHKQHGKQNVTSVCGGLRYSSYKKHQSVHRGFIKPYFTKTRSNKKISSIFLKENHKNHE